MIWILKLAELHFVISLVDAMCLEGKHAGEVSNVSEFRHALPWLYSDRAATHLLSLCSKVRHLDAASSGEILHP